MSQPENTMTQAIARELFNRICKDCGQCDTKDPERQKMLDKSFKTDKTKEGKT